MVHPPNHDRGVPSEDQLERMLADAESSVSQLRRELTLVRNRRVSEAEQAAQHAEIDRLTEHLSQAQVHWNEVWGFFEAALQELRGARTGEPTERTTDDTSQN